MNQEAERLLAAAVKAVGLRGSFDPADIGAKAGLSRNQAESAARALSNAGVLALGFDMAAHFTVDYRRANSPKEPKPSKKKVVEPPPPEPKPTGSKSASKTGTSLKPSGSQKGADSKPTTTKSVDAKVAAKKSGAKNKAKA